MKDSLTDAPIVIYRILEVGRRVSYLMTHRRWLEEGGGVYQNVGRLSATALKAREGRLLLNRET